MNTTTSTDISIDTSTALIEYANNILFVRIKEDADISEEQVKEQYSARDQLVGADKFFVLVDARALHNTTRDAREYIAKASQPNRIAMAIVTKHLATRIVANFYMNFNKPLTPTKMFNTEEEGMKWLRQLMSK